MVERLLRGVQEDLRSIKESQRSIQEGAIHEEAKAEDDKDTRAIESSYLALGLAKRVAELEGMVSGLVALNIRVFSEDDPIALSALVTVEDEEEKTARYLLAPAGGGLRVEVDGVEIKVVTPQSPLGRALVGKRCGDDVTIRTPKGPKDCAVIAIC